MADLSVKMAGVTFKNPVIPASGAFGFGREYEQFYPLSKLGGLSIKGTTLNRRDGNPPPRIAETPSGILNSVGLQNPGIDAFLANELPNLAKKDTAVLANIAGASVEDFAEIARRIEASPLRDAVDLLELNISCPNVKEGGAAFGCNPRIAADVTAAVRAVTSKPIMVKLTPNVTDITVVARAVEEAGADAVSLINTLLGMRIDIESRRPILHNNVGGLSGPAVFPVAVRMVWQVSRAVKIPVCGLGGISSWKDAIEMMMAGATTIQVGTALFADPLAPIKIIEGMNRWLDEHHISSVAEIIGTVEPY